MELIFPAVEKSPDRLDQNPDVPRLDEIGLRARLQCLSPILVPPRAGVEDDGRRIARLTNRPAQFDA